MDPDSTSHLMDQCMKDYLLVNSEKLQVCLPSYVEVVAHSKVLIQQCEDIDSGYQQVASVAEEACAQCGTRVGRNNKRLMEMQKELVNLKSRIHKKR